jgi:hypothetical protein
MLTINRLREFLSETKEAIPKIKYIQTIVTNDEFVLFLKERKSSDNIMLFGVVPEHGIIGREDQTNYQNYLQFFFLDKSATKDLKQDKKLDIYNNVQLVVKSFIDLILAAKAGETQAFGNCSLLQQLEEESIEIKTFWDGFECRGYNVMFNLYSN